MQVQLYFPQFGHPAYGIVRAIAKDSSDYYEGLSSITFLDSDGRVRHIQIYCDVLSTSGATPPQCVLCKSCIGSS